MTETAWCVLLGTAAILLAGCGSPSDAERYVGLRLPPEPSGVETEAGWLLEPSGDVEFAASLTRDGAGRMLWLERLAGWDAEGTPRREVIGVERLPELRPGEEFSLMGCREGGSGDMANDLVAITRSSDTAEILGDVRHAWRADIPGRRFVSVPAENVECLNGAEGV